MSMEYVKHDEKIKQIAVDVTRCIKNRVTIYWINQDNIKAAIHQDVKTILFKFDYTPEDVEKLMPKITQQAEINCGNTNLNNIVFTSW